MPEPTPPTYPSHVRTRPRIARSFPARNPHEGGTACAGFSGVLLSKILQGEAVQFRLKV